MSTNAAISGTNGGTELADLLSPITIEVFLSDYWARRPLYIQGDERKFDGLFDRSELDRALRYSAVARLKASYDRGATLADIDPDDIDSAYDSGATLCASFLETGSSRLMALCESVRKQLGHVGKVDVRAYLSPDGTGFGLHYDARVAMTLQLEGRKRWKFGTAPSVAWPPRNARDLEMSSELAASAEYAEVTLGPGDVLCLPAGTWHSAAAEGHSFALNVAISQMSFFYLAMEQLNARLLEDPFWREPLPPTGPVGRHASGTLPAAVGDYLGPRFAALGRMFTELSESTDAQREFWYLSLLSPRRAHAYTSLTGQSAGTAEAVSVSEPWSQPTR